MQYNIYPVDGAVEMENNTGNFKLESVNGMIYNYGDISDGGYAKRAETKRQEGSRKRGRPQLRWEDCVKRDLRKAKEEEKWKENANNRDRWKLITKVAVLRSDQ